MGFRSDLNVRYGKDFETRVENVKKFTREDFANPEIGETKWLRVLEHPKLVPEVTTHDAFVVKVDEILHTGYDQEGNPQYKVLRPNVNYWLGLNTAAQLVGGTEKRLSPTGKKPDDDYGCIINSTWSIEGAENPKAATKGYTSDKMYILTLLELDQKIVDTILGGGEGTGKISVENIPGPSPM